jgi:CRISPR-associated endonuclease/helicase Cas3
MIGSDSGVMFPSSFSRAPWGKTASDGSSHHLAHHCADVAACFEAITEQPALRAALEKAAGRPLDDITLSRLTVLAFLHDAGKLHAGFQARGWPDESRIQHHGHTGEGIAIFLNGAGKGLIAKHLHIETLRTWGDGEALVNLLHAVFAHHGRPVELKAEHLNGWNTMSGPPYDAAAAAESIGARLPVWFAPAFEPGGSSLPQAPEFQHLFCGLVALADWLGSNRALFEFSADLQPNYMEEARAKARKAVRGIGLNTAPWRRKLTQAPAFAALAPQRTPRAAQSTIGNWPLNDPLVILEAETGSGKTEAALWRFAQLFAAGKVDGLYFAVPTRAAAKQLHNRVHAAMISLFGADAPQAILAIPGYLRAGEHEGQALPHFDVLWDDAPDERQRLARWAAESARRFLAAPVAVGTVDQAMLAALQVKHAHLRGAALSRSLLVIDEVHASDGYMTEVQAHLLESHLKRGGFSMLMSATLGSDARARWLEGRRGLHPSFAEAASTPYPAVWGKTSAMRAVGAEGREKRVHMHLAASWTAEEATSRAIAAARAGARVLIIRNTVSAAIATFEAVRTAGEEGLLWQVSAASTLHHSRFAPEDRRLLDEAVEATLSPDTSKRSPVGVIVIGTQTLEQSLDICADFLITDLCPADVLLQRLGRLHRHALPRPTGFEMPRCVVLAPEAGLDAFTAPKFENGLGMFRDSGGVYRNLHACELTKRLVEQHPEWVIPSMNRLIVESALHPERIEALNAEKGRAWAAYWSDVYGKDLAEAQAVRGVRLDATLPFADLLFPADEEKIRTRLGAEGTRIEFVPGTIGPFDGAISAITCPSHWKGIMPDGPVAAERDGQGNLRFTVGDREFRYSKIGFYCFINTN